MMMSQKNDKRQGPYWYLVILMVVMTIGIIAIIDSCSSGGDGESVPAVFEENEFFSFDKIPADNYTDLNLVGVNGEITITGMSVADSVMISGVKRVQSKISAEDASLHLPELEATWQSDANEIHVETIQPKDSAEQNYTIDYTITLPSYFRIQVNSINGRVTLDTIENVVSVNMVNAQVILKNIDSSATVNIATGSIDAEVILPLNGSLDLSTATGGIQLAIPTNTQAKFSATTIIGNITVSDLVFQEVNETPKSLSGTLGTGQGMITLKAMGDISVSGFL